MFQLKNLIGRTAVPKDPEKNMHGVEDFMLLLVHTFVCAAACQAQLDKPCSGLKELAKKIITSFVQLPSESCHNIEQDLVHLYAKEKLTLGLLWHGFHDSIKESDGDHILTYWKVFLVVFKLTNHRNYAKEAVNVLYQYYYTFSERQRAQLLWSRCMNTRGYAGCNIPCDLHMEHV